jgi:tetratricopeptide (TPR) repeat protein
MQEAADVLHRALEIDSNFYYTPRNLGLALVGEGDYQHAIEEYQKARALSEEPRILALLAHAYGLSGNRAEAANLLEQLKMLSRQRYVSAYSFVLVYIGLGDKEKTLDWLEQSFVDRAGSDIAKIRFDPLLEPLRGEPRFEELAKRVLAKAPKQP